MIMITHADISNDMTIRPLCGVSLTPGQAFIYVDAEELKRDGYLALPVDVDCFRCKQVAGIRAEKVSQI